MFAWGKFCLRRMTFASQRERRLCYVAVTLAMVEVDDKHFDLEMQLRPTGRVGRRCTVRKPVPPCAGAIRAHETSARWLASYRAAARRPRSIFDHNVRRCTVGASYTCARARRRAALGAIRARETSARWRRSHGSAVGLYHTTAVAKIGFRRPLARKRQPPAQRFCRLGCATGVTPIEGSRRFGAIRAVDSCFWSVKWIREATGHVLNSKAGADSLSSPQPARSLRARQAPGPLGTRRLVICSREPAGDCAPRLSTRAERTWPAPTKGSKAKQLPAKVIRASNELP